MLKLNILLIGVEAEKYQLTLKNSAMYYKNEKCGYKPLILKMIWKDLQTGILQVIRVYLG